MDFAIIIALLACIAMTSSAFLLGSFLGTASNYRLARKNRARQIPETKPVPEEDSDASLLERAKVREDELRALMGDGPEMQEVRQQLHQLRVEFLAPLVAERAVNQKHLDACRARIAPYRKDWQLRAHAMMRSALGEEARFQQAIADATRRIAKCMAFYDLIEPVIRASLAAQDQVSSGNPAQRRFWSPTTGKVSTSVNPTEVVHRPQPKHAPPTERVSASADWQKVVPRAQPAHARTRTAEDNTTPLQRNGRPRCWTREEMKKALESKSFDTATDGLLSETSEDEPEHCKFHRLEEFFQPEYVEAMTPREVSGTVTSFFNVLSEELFGAVRDVRKAREEVECVGGSSSPEAHPRPQHMPSNREYC